MKANERKKETRIVTPTERDGFNNKQATLSHPLLDGGQGKTKNMAIEEIVHNVRQIQVEIVGQGDCCREECISNLTGRKAHMDDKKVTTCHPTNGKVKMKGT